MRESSDERVIKLVIMERSDLVMREGIKLVLEFVISSLLKHHLGEATELQLIIKFLGLASLETIRSPISADWELIC
jgi:hypothetical protein